VNHGLRGLGVLLTCLLTAPSVASCTVLGGTVTLTAVQKDLSPHASPRDFKTIEVTVSNFSASVARGVVVQDRLPSQFTFVSTTKVGGDAIRTQTLEPGIGSPSPSWGTWSLPAASSPTHPATLDLQFEVAVGRAPANTPNFVNVSSDASDPTAAPPIVLTVVPTPIVDMLISSRSPVAAGGTAQYTIELRNTGLAAADSVFVVASLSSGFLYANTDQLSGNSIRGAVTDPLAASLLPSWGTWAIPPSQPDGSAGVLRIVFSCKVAADEPAGQYPISVTVTYNGLPTAQTAADQAPVTVVKGH